MRINRLMPVLLVLYSTTVTSARPQASESRLPALARKELRDLTRKWDESLVKKDIQSLEEILARDYAFTGVPRSEYLTALETPGAEYTSYERRVLEVRVYGDAALVFSHTSVDGKSPHVGFSSEFQSMDVWIWHESRWKCVATMTDQIKSVDSRGNIEFGPHLKADLVILFKAGVTDQQVDDFLHKVLERPNPYGGGYTNQQAVSGIMRVLPIDGHKVLSVTFFEEATQEARDQIKSKTKSASIVYTVFEGIAPRDVKVK